MSVIVKGFRNVMYVVWKNLPCSLKGKSDLRAQNEVKLTKIWLISVIALLQTADKTFNLKIALLKINAAISGMM